MLIVDRSGSMATIRNASQDAINEFIAGQGAAEGRRTIRLDQFDDHHETVFPSTEAVACPRFSLVPRGGTALYDAIGRGINAFGAELAAMMPNLRPANVVVGIMTDGGENSSREFNLERIKSMIEHQQYGYRWQFLFMGANQDAVLTAQGMGLGAGSAITYTASSVGTRSVIGTFNEAVAVASTGLTYEVTDEDREEAQK